MTSRTELKVQDVAIKLHRAGRGPSVLFLHGAGGAPQWLPFFDVLAERYFNRCDPSKRQPHLDTLAITPVLVAGELPRSFGAFRLRQA